LADSKITSVTLTRLRALAHGIARGETRRLSLRHEAVPEEACARNVMVDADFIAAQAAEILAGRCRQHPRVCFRIVDRFDRLPPRKQTNMLTLGLV
jgi:hypothetical protein